jgi:hypothetical protein
MLRILHCLDNRLTDGGKFVSVTDRPRSTPRKHYFSVSATQFYYRPSDPQGLMRQEGLGTLKKCINFVGPRIRDLPACNIYFFFASTWRFGRTYYLLFQVGRASHEINHQEGNLCWFLEMRALSFSETSVKYQTACCKAANLCKAANVRGRVLLQEVRKILLKNICLLWCFFDV